ncbi:hypothetical protein evm_002706 [Chilo suppressalis]|nr:hypothetical protein evm_002706 [Chilo suppressalis]
MIPSRFSSGQSAAMRKSRLEGKPSMLPKPRRPGSTDRLSTEARRPSTTGQRSSSAEPRGTLGASRFSREASATKKQLNGRSRSQQGDRGAQSFMTPLRSSHFSARPVTGSTPRTPSEDHSSRNWQTSLERTLAFVTIKDQRPLSNAGWQRAELARVQEALSARGGAEGGSMALIRPLTIARFVDVVGALVAATAITRDTSLNTDNYVTKLPHLSKRLLYPGTVAKSWLKTVNTLHAFPHALGLIAYLLDLVNHIDIYALFSFQDPGHQFEDLNEEYLQNLKLLLGNDEEKIADLKQIIKKYEACLEDEAEVAARAEEAQLAERRDSLLSQLRSSRAANTHARAQRAAARARAADLARAAQQLDHDMERAACVYSTTTPRHAALPAAVSSTVPLTRTDIEFVSFASPKFHCQICTDF